MYLKKIEIHGFKSFADRTEIEFEKGITGIVGPNGSGKSNVSDAIRWVLGEQSAKTLRGSKMEDVIFAGTTRRKPVGMAEVSLTLDNTSGKLPLDYSEVTITRRVYRSGESEYYINKSLCRLKDIKEIFMDTGVGVDGYSIIGQGRIDEILSNKSEDRRLLFEEAAGIVKYKLRKEEAEKKLENTNQNLIRVNDIIYELESRIEPLKAQSQKAKAFLELQKELKHLEINLIVHELEELKYSIETLVAQKKVITNQLNNYLKDKTEIELKYKNLKTKIEELDQSINVLQNNIFETMHLIEKKEGELNLCNEKINNISENTVRLSSEINDMDKQIYTLSIQLSRMEEKLQYLIKLFHERQTLLNEKLVELNTMNIGLEKQEEEMEKAKSNVIELLNTIASKKSELQSLTALCINITKRQNQICDEMEQLERKKRGLLEEQQTIDDHFANLQRELEKLHGSKVQTCTEIEKLITTIHDQRKQSEVFRQKIHERQTRKHLLEEMERAYEGFNKSVKNTLIHTKKDAHLGKGIFGVVAELINVPKGLEIAIEVALGSTMQNIVCQSAEDANRVINYLKENDIGRVTFLPIDSIKSNNVQLLNENEFINFKGFIGLAINLVHYSKKYSNIFQNLLGRVILVDKIENGILIAKNTGHKYKIVSLDGDIINSGGAITGGSYHSKTANILGRRREIEELDHAIHTISIEYNNQIKKMAQHERKLETLKEKREEIENSLREKEIERINLENTKKQLEKEIENYQQNMNRINKEIEQLSSDKSETQISIKNKEKEINELEIAKEEIQNRVSNSKSAYEEEKTLKEKISEEVTNLKIDIASIEQKKQYLEHEILEVSNKIDALKSVKTQKQNEINELEIHKNMLLEKLNQLKIEIKDTDVLKQQCEFNLTQVKLNKKEISKSYEEVERQLQKINEVITELQDSNHKLEVKLTRLEMQQESYLNKLWEDYEVTYVEALDYKNGEINVTESVKTIKTLKNKMQDMGTINLNAIQEYEEVTERYNFLTAQKEDLINAQNLLNKVIKEMENIMRVQFISCFKKIKQNFDEVFKKLFGGGRAELKLEDEEDVLTTGIEIIAQPPGKKLQHLSLLSGGERALTAISLLFAILKVKPTPFCILDEIEAALDDANVYRYANFLKEFSNETQFIVVTHRKGTMEAVDALYGVTMQEEGISKLVSVKLTEKAS